MTKSTDQIEREVEMTRASVEDTVEALKDKMSVGQMVDEAQRYFRDSGGGELVANLGDQVRTNPIPLALIGVGLAWLMSGRGQPAMSYSRRGSRYYEEDYDDDLWAAEYDTEVGAGRYRGGGAYVAGGSRGFDETDAGSHRSMSERASEMASRAGGAAAGAGGSVRSGVSSAGSAIGSGASAVGGAASSAAGSVAGGIRHAGSAAGSAARYAGDSAYSAAHYAGGAYRRTSRGAAYVGRRAQRTFLDVLEEEPLVLGAVGLAVGAAIGALLPSTETEDRYLGGTRDRLMDDAEDMAREQWEHGTQVAGQAYEAARSEVQSGQGGTLADKAERAVKAAVDTAKGGAAPDASSGTSAAGQGFSGGSSSSSGMKSGATGGSTSAGSGGKPGGSGRTG